MARNVIRILGSEFIYHLSKLIQDTVIMLVVTLSKWSIEQSTMIVTYDRYGLFGMICIFIGKRIIL